MAAQTTLPRKPRLKPIAGGRALPRPASVGSATRTLALEVEGLNALADELGGALAAALRRRPSTCCKAARGRVIVTGIGKSGHVGQKVAATFASTGTPAFFVHPSEASHGDLGMITRDDLVLAMSWSGETVELKNIITFSRRFAVPLIAITSRAESALGQGRRRRPRAAEGQGGLPARPGADHLDDDAARARRRAGDRAAGGQGLHRARLQGVPPRRLARRPAQVRRRRDAQGRAPAARRRRRCACRRRSW